MKFYIGELFSGPGGLALGAALAKKQISDSREVFKIKHSWGVDKDPAAIGTYIHNICKKYRGFGFPIDAMDFCMNYLDCYDPINALAFGFPCNDFSLVGESKGLHGKYGELYKAGVFAIKHFNPLFFIAENVSGIHSANQGKAFKQILNELENSGKYGYELTVHLYKFEEYGVPQMRHRFIIVGIRKDQNLKFNVPAPTHGKGKKPFVTVKKQLSKPIKGNVTNTKITLQDRRVVERLKFTPPWQNAWYLDELFGMSNSERRKILKELDWYKNEIAFLSDDEIKVQIDDARLKCTKARMSHIYRRLDANKPSYTITGSGGGGTHVYHWNEHRALTNRERARLQTFPDWFEFKGSKEQVRKQIGMAVPPKASKQIFEAILKTFAGIEYPSVEANYP